MKARITRIFRRIFGRVNTDYKSLDFCIALAQIEHGPISYKSTLTQAERDVLWDMIKSERVTISVGGGTIEASLGFRVEPLKREDLK